MSQSSGRLSGKMKWLVTRYPKAPGQLIALGAILSDPEEPETRLNRHDAKEIDPKYIIDESVAVQRTIQAEVSNDDSILLKVAQPLLGAGLGADGKLSKDSKTVLDALDVKAKIFLPDKEYMDASVEVPGVQDYVKACNFSKKLYMIMGVASANKLSVDEDTSQQDSAGFHVAAKPVESARMTAEVQHRHSKKAVSGLKIEEECDFAYRIREFTYWKHRRDKVNMKGDRSTGSLFRVGNEFDEDDDDDDDENFETVPMFNDLKNVDVAGSASGLSTFEV